MIKILVTGGSGFIGSYFIDMLLKDGHFEILNIDIAEPTEKNHLKVWQQVDIRDKDRTINAFKAFQAKYVVHLAARTDTDPENVLEDYDSNTIGTANVLEAIRLSGSVERVIITSTQFVHQHKDIPAHDEDYAPHTVYGESKVITEKLTRAANLNCTWTIIRPTNIWGPRHPRYPKEFWHVLKQGRYIHPGHAPVIRSYGYVGNVTDQMLKILNEDSDKIHQQVFYVGDEPMDQYKWVNGFSVALNQRNVQVVPRFMVRGLAIAGEILKKIHVKFPITLSRYKSMTTSNPAPMQKTFKTLGPSKYSLQQGIEETVEWLRKQDRSWN